MHKSNNNKRETAVEEASIRKIKVVILATLFFILVFSSITASAIEHNQYTFSRTTAMNRNGAIHPENRAKGPANPQSSPTPEPISTPPSINIPAIFSGYPLWVWQEIGEKPEEISSFLDVAVCEIDGFRIFVAGTTKGIYVYDEQAANPSWEPQAVEEANGVILSVNVVPDGQCDKFYAAARDTGLFFADNPAANWTKIYPLSEGANLRAVESRLRDNQDKYDVFIGGDFGIRYADSPESPGAVWNPIKQTGIFVTGLTIDRSRNVGRIYAATWQDNIYLNDPDDGNSEWLSQTPPEAENRLYEVARGTGGYVAGTHTGTFYYDQDLPQPGWEKASGFTSFKAYAVAASDNAIYSGEVNSPVLVSRDQGESWQKLEEGMCSDSYDKSSYFEDFQTWGLTIEGDGSLYAATTTGIWRWTGEP